MTYLKPWNRKAGVVTLLLACVFAAGWVRSLDTADGLNSQTGQLISFKGGIFGEVLLQPFDFHVSYASQGPNIRGKSDLYSDPKMVRFWRWRYFGFAYRTEKVAVQNENATQSTVTVVRFIVPYWSIVIPLTAMSAWILFSKPRLATKPSKIAGDEPS